VATWVRIRKKQQRRQGWRQHSSTKLDIMEMISTSTKQYNQQACISCIIHLLVEIKESKATNAI
jgi:hypothetical protein